MLKTMDSISIAAALQMGVKDYNQWAMDKAFSENDEKELRGVLYNKVKLYMKDVPGWISTNHSFRGNLLETRDLVPTFKVGMLVLLDINLWAKSYHSSQKSNFLKSLKEAASTLLYSQNADKYYYDLVSIVEQLKSFKV